MRMKPIALLAMFPLLATATPLQAAQTYCPAIYQPVCAKKADQTRTFSNRCLADSAGYAVIETGQCGESGSHSRLGNKSLLRLGQLDVQSPPATCNGAPRGHGVKPGKPC